MKHFPSRHVVFFSLFGFATVLGSAVAATPAADIAALRAKAEQGNPIAQYNLGLACADLHESFYDPVEAYVWLNLAATGGTTGKALSAIIDTMTPAQLAEGQRRVAARRTNHVAVATSPIGVPSVASEKPAADTVADASKEADALKVSLNAQLADAQKKLAEANGQAVTDKSTLQRLVDQLAGYNQRLTQESVQAKSDAEHLGKQVAELKNAVNAAVTEQKTQQAKAEQLASQLAATNKILEDKQQSLDAVNAKIEDLNKAVAEGQKSAEEAARLRNLSETLKQDMNALQYALKTDREKSAAALEAVNVQLKRVREANRALAEANKALINTQAAQ